MPTPANFLDAHGVAEAQAVQFAKPSFAVMIARSASGVVLAFNPWREPWELPGGFIDAGETPRAAAARELTEEAGCVARDVSWIGLVSVNEGATHYGAAYRCEVDSVAAAFTSEETGGVGLWTLAEHPRPLEEADHALLLRYA